MGDLQFAKQFLTTLDSKPTKYQADHAFDPKSFQLRIPYTLPKLSSPPHPPPPITSPSSAPPPGSELAIRTLTLVLKSARNPAMILTLPSIDPSSTTFQALKEQIQSHLGGPSAVSVDKIKVLLNKKPVAASKRTVAEALEGSTDGLKGDVEFGVMVMGGAPDPVPQAHAPPILDPQMATTPGSEKAPLQAEATAMEGVEKTTAAASEPVQPGEPRGVAVLETGEFWDDLQGFLEQRLRSSEEAEKVRGVFERAWRSADSKP